MDQVFMTMWLATALALLLVVAHMAVVMRSLGWGRLQQVFYLMEDTPGHYREFCRSRGVHPRGFVALYFPLLYLFGAETVVMVLLTMLGKGRAVSFVTDACFATGPLCPECC